MSSLFRVHRGGVLIFSDLRFYGRIAGILTLFSAVFTSFCPCGLDSSHTGFLCFGLTEWNINLKIK